MEKYIILVKAKQAKSQQISLEQLPLAMKLLLF
jgi:hypothetical protein